MKYIKVKFDIADGDGVRMEEGLLLQTAKDILCQLAGNIGFDSFEDEGATVTGYVQKQLFDRPELDSILAGFPIMNLNITYEAQDAEDKNWNEAWEENGFEPITVNGKCVIHDTTHTPPHRGNGMEITIDTKQAFGTGGHETTYMIVSELLDSDVKGKRVLDCGCGTGINRIRHRRMERQQHEAQLRPERRWQRDRLTWRRKRDQHTGDKIRHDIGQHQQEHTAERHVCIQVGNVGRRHPDIKRILRTRR